MNKVLQSMIGFKTIWQLIVKQGLIILSPAVLQGVSQQSRFNEDTFATQVEYGRNVLLGHKENN